MEKKQKILFKLIKKLIKNQPYFAVIILHEYFRSLFPFDPHIKFKIDNPIKRISDLQTKLIKICNYLLNIGFYKIKFKKEQKKELKEKTGEVYGVFWKKIYQKRKYKI